jgi:FHS family L-fucose permease-like MFS transporter
LPFFQWTADYDASHISNRITSIMNNKKGLFEMPDGKKLTFTFFLVSSLFLIWGFCNGMIDTMDKHFQEHLHLNLSQSAWVQFAHYMGYAIMALPAGLLTRKLGYRWGIIFGLMLVSIGGIWFVPATHIDQFWAFLMGVCLIAMGLSVLETVANPYTTVLGPKEYGPMRINLAQSFNGVGWPLGPIAGSAFFYSAGGAEEAQKHLYIPYLGVGIFVLVIALMFVFAPVPDIKVEDEYHTDDTTTAAPTIQKEKNPALVLLMIFLNVAAVGLSIYLICNTILPSVVSLDAFDSVQKFLPWVIIVAVLATLPALNSMSKKVTAHSIWAHPHFSAATLAQFLYVAAQAGIFSFFINCMTTNAKTGFTMVPNIPASWSSGWLGQKLFAAGSDGVFHISDQGAATLASAAFICFLLGRISGSALLKKFSAHKMLCAYGFINAVVCLFVIGNLGWISVAGVFLSYFFMSIMYPTIFALGIHGLGSQARKKAAAFIVMSITGGALMPKFMGHLGDIYNLCTAFWMPFACFILIGIYGLCWSKLSQSEGVLVAKSGSGH